MMHNIRMCPLNQTGFWVNNDSGTHENLSVSAIANFVLQLKVDRSAGLYSYDEIQIEKIK